MAKLSLNTVTGQCLPSQGLLSIKMSSYHALTKAFAFSFSGFCTAMMLCISCAIEFLFDSEYLNSISTCMLKSDAYNLSLFSFTDLLLVVVRQMYSLSVYSMVELE